MPVCFCRPFLLRRLLKSINDSLKFSLNVGFRPNNLQKMLASNWMNSDSIVIHSPRTVSLGILNDSSPHSIAPMLRASEFAKRKTNALSSNKLPGNCHLALNTKAYILHTQYSVCTESTDFRNKTPKALAHLYCQYESLSKTQTIPEATRLINSPKLTS